MPLELVGKDVKLSDGKVGVIRSFDPKDIEYPTVAVGGREFKTSKELHCVSMC
jgi:hypothetical protein